MVRVVFHACLHLGRERTRRGIGVALPKLTNIPHNKVLINEGQSKQSIGISQLSSPRSIQQTRRWWQSLSQIITKFKQPNQ